MINRFERKFVFKQTSAKNIEILIKLNKVGFYEIFYERYINNIYFDTINFDNYYDNIDGVSDRVKYRVRWYNDFFLNSKDAVFDFIMITSLISPLSKVPIISVLFVGSIGRSFQEALHKATQSLEIKRNGLGADGKGYKDYNTIISKLTNASWDRVFVIYDAIKLGISLERIHEITKIDMWFLKQYEELFYLEKEIMKFSKHQSQNLANSFFTFPSNLQS